MNHKIESLMGSTKTDFLQRYQKIKQTLGYTIFFLPPVQPSGTTCLLVRHHQKECGEIAQLLYSTTTTTQDTFFLEFLLQLKDPKKDAKFGIKIYIINDILLQKLYYSSIKSTASLIIAHCSKGGCKSKSQCLQILIKYKFLCPK